MTTPLVILLVLACITLGICLAAWAGSKEHESSSAAVAIWGLVWIAIFMVFFGGSYHANHGGWIPPGCRTEAPTKEQP